MKALIPVFLLFIPVLAFSEMEAPMTLPTANAVLTFSAGSLIAVESMMLLVGMNLPQPGSWSTVANLTTGVSDVVLGAYLVYRSFGPSEVPATGVDWAVLGVLALTHVFRDLEYFTAPSDARFLANLPLFVLNNLRLGLVLAAAGSRLVPGG